jgi:hypothetical protein
VKKTTDTVNDMPKTVPETDESVNEAAEIVSETDLAVIELEPRTNQLVQNFEWNFAELKTSLDQKTQKYVGLVVTEENLKSMEDTQKEVAGLRTKIDAFRKKVKKQLNEPYEKFEGQIKELLTIVEAVEKPLQQQILSYEDERRRLKEAELREFGLKTALNLGLRTEYNTLVIDTKWTNRTAKDSTVRKEIVTDIETMLWQQRQADEAAKLRRQRYALIEQLCEVNSKTLQLSTPVTPLDVATSVEHATLAEIPDIIIAECQKRADMERKAAEAVQARIAAETAAIQEPLPPVEPDPGPPMPPVLPPRSADPPMPPGFRPTLPPAFMPPPPMPAAPELWDATLRVIGVTVAQAEALKVYMNGRGIQFEFSGYARRESF